jgi:O-methyltransferase
MNTRELLDKGKDERAVIKSIIESLIDKYELKGPEGFGVLFEGFNLPRWLPFKGMFEGKMGFGQSEERMYNIQQFAKAAMKHGNIAAEFGVYTGYTTRMLFEMGFYVVAFDSFSGIKGSGEHDIMQDGEFSAEDVLSETLERINGDEIVIGTLPGTLEGRDDRFNFVHLDLDVYEPTLEVLRYVYPRMFIGGVIVLDDYGYHITPGIKKAVDEFVAESGAKFIYLTSGQGVILV